MSLKSIRVCSSSDNRHNEEQELNFPVTKNLYMALRDLRFPEKNRRLWVDAICINQSDSDENKVEKNLQVSRMRDIYLTADRIVAHLGEQGDAKETIEFCQSLVQDSTGNVPAFYASSVEQRRACLRLFSLSGPEKFKPATQEKTTRPHANKEDEVSSDQEADGVERPYWTRSWILQELIHNRPVTVYHGTHPETLESFLHAYSLWHQIVIVADSQLSVGNLSLTLSANEKKQLLHEMWFRTVDSDEVIPEIVAIERAKFQKGTPEIPRLPALLKKFRGQKAGVPADKIYAFLGLTTNEYHIQPDYSKSTYDVYTEMTKQNLMKNVLLVLLWVESSGREIKAGEQGKTLPSWVPDFTTEQKLIALCFQSTYNAFDAFYPAPSPTDMWRWNFEEDVLVLKGKSVGVVTEVLPLSHVTRHSSGHEYDQITLIRYDSSVDDCQMTNNSLQPTYENTSWGPSKCEKGDIIIVAGGCRLPLVLRRCESGQDKDNDRYLFVGGCWLIVSQLQDLTQINQGKKEESTGEIIYPRDPGFSRIMFGSLKNDNDGLEAVERFRVY